MDTPGNKAAKKAKRNQPKTSKPVAPIRIGNPIPVFFCVETGDVDFYYGRMSRTGGCLGGPGLHSARKYLPRMRHEEQPIGWPPITDPCWPTKCDLCDFEFTTDNSMPHSGANHIYKRQDTGEIVERFTVGAVYDQKGYHDYRTGADGRSLVCVVPGGHPWFIDGRANNCTEPTDDKHRCWVRTGKPEDGTLSVGKGGRTCKAGAGSIDTGQWHGFLRNGKLVDC